MRKLICFFAATLLFSCLLQAQEKDTKKEEERIERIEIEGEIVKILISGDDTLMIADLEDVNVISPASFKDNEEYRYYLKTRYRAAKVYPYAVEAIKVFREIEEFSKDTRKREKKKYIRKLQKDLSEKFEKPLKNLSRSQGRVLVEMIEREVGVSTFKVIKEIKGGFKATYWHNLGKFFGYNLKKPYDPEEDHILEMVLKSFDISHDL